MTDKWLYCLYCPLNGHCENQTRGIECETGLKELVQKMHTLEQQLQEANKVIKGYSDESIYLFPTWYNGSFEANKYLKKWGVK